MTPEGRVKKAIKDWMDSQNCYYFMPVQTGYGRRTVDILLCWYGYFVAIEIKRANGRVRKFQERIIGQVNEARGFAVCVDSLEALQSYLHIAFEVEI